MTQIWNLRTSTMIAARQPALSSSSSSAAASHDESNMQKPSGRPLHKIESCPTLPSESQFSCCYCLVDLHQRPISDKMPLRSSLKIKSQSESLQRPALSFSSSSRKTTFDTVETREYPYMLGCNPSVSQGTLPLTIAWCPLDQRIQSIDEFEESRGPRRLFLKLPETAREESLRQAGYTTDDLQKVLEEIGSIQQSREVSKRDGVSDLRNLMAEARWKKLERKKNKKRGLRRIMSF